MQRYNACSPVRLTSRAQHVNVQNRRGCDMSVAALTHRMNGFLRTCRRSVQRRPRRKAVQLAVDQASSSSRDTGWANLAPRFAKNTTFYAAPGTPASRPDRGAEVIDGTWPRRPRRRVHDQAMARRLFARAEFVAAISTSCRRSRQDADMPQAQSRLSCATEPTTARFVLGATRPSGTNLAQRTRN